MLQGMSLMAQTPIVKNGSKVKDFFTKLDKNNLHLIEEFYSKDVNFIDPVGKISSSKDIRKYYEGMYKNVKYIKFDFTDIYEKGDTVIAVWNMHLETDKLNGGEPFNVEGNSIIKFNSEGKAAYHRDYFDMGEFIYERIPVIGFIVKKIKHNMEVSKD